MNRYAITIYWSNEDQTFVAEVPELPGCMAHGITHQEAMDNIQDAMTLWLNTAAADPLPEWQCRELDRRMADYRVGNLALYDWQEVRWELGIGE